MIKKIISSDFWKIQRHDLVLRDTSLKYVNQLEFNFIDSIIDEAVFSAKRLK